MSIVEKIIIMAYDYHACTGRKPTYVLMGRNELHNLIRESHKYMGYTPGRVVDKVAGMKIQEVEGSFLKVAYIQETGDLK